MFEIRRVDTSAVHLHYHKNGSLDDPVIIDAMPQNANSGASQPTVPDIQLNPSQPVIGRREAVLALNLLLNQYRNNGPGAVDITDGNGFDWRGFVQNTMEHLEIKVMELEKVFALRRANFGSPQLAFCTPGTTWKMMDPTQNVYKNTRLPGLQDISSNMQGMSSNLRTDPLFLQATTMLGRNWMRMR